jgi:hypothetical protein
MKKVTGKTAKKSAKIPQKTKGTSHTRKTPGEGSGLAHRYQQIGISAVAAAARYQGVAKSPAYTPALNAWYDRGEDAAA